MNSQSSEYGEKNYQNYILEVKKTPLLSQDQEIDLAVRIKRGDPEARNQMIAANLLLVVKIAGDFIGRGLSLMDLISEGNIGLMKAVERFDLDKGAKLSTYAWWWIRQSLQRALANQSKTMRLPVHVFSKVSKILRTADRMEISLDTDTWVRELARELWVEVRWILYYLSVSRKPISLDAPLDMSSGRWDGESDEDMWSEMEITYDDCGAQSPYEALVDDEMLRKIPELLNIFDNDKRTMDILENRFGLNGLKTHTLDEVGKMINVTRERVRQLQNIALSKMRRELMKIEDSTVPEQARWLGKYQPKKINSSLDPIGLMIPKECEQPILDHLNSWKNKWAPKTRERAKVLLEKLIKNPNLTPRDFRDSLTPPEMDMFGPWIIVDLVMPNGRAYLCLKELLNELK